MRRLGLIVFQLLFCAACSGTSGSTNDLTPPPADAGPDAVHVILDGGGTPATPPNGTAACPAGVCNYQAGTGCVGAMSSCLPGVVGGKAVATCYMPGAFPNGHSCSGATDCVAGHLCSGGVCRKLCCGGDWTGCDSATEHCLDTLEYGTDAGIVTTGAMLCHPVNDCDALNPSSCTQPGTACLVADATGATACLTNGTGTAGSPCPCKGGFTCVQPKGKSPVCVRLCKDVPGGGAPYCQANEGICTHYSHDPPNVGECSPP